MFVGVLGSVFVFHELPSLKSGHRSNAAPESSAEIGAPVKPPTVTPCSGVHEQRWNVRRTPGSRIHIRKRAVAIASHSSVQHHTPALDDKTVRPGTLNGRSAFWNIGRAYGIGEDDSPS